MKLLKVLKGCFNGFNWCQDAQRAVPQEAPAETDAQASVPQNESTEMVVNPPVVPAGGDVAVEPVNDHVGEQPSEGSSTLFAEDAFEPIFTIPCPSN